MLSDIFDIMGLIPFAIIALAAVWLVAESLIHGVPVTLRRLWWESFPPID